MSHPLPLKLVRHTLFNLLGLGAPLLIAVGSIPALLQALGPERFGLLALIWAVTSYFSLFDLGLGRALTQQLAPSLERGDWDSAGSVCTTALGLMTGLGLAGGLLLACLAPWGVGHLRELPDPAEAVRSGMVMAVAIPFVVLTAGLRGILEARHAFAWLNLIRLPMGIWTFAGPWLVVWLQGPDLVMIAWVLAAGRVLGLLIHGMAVWLLLPQLRGHWRWDARVMPQLLVSGGWLTVGNLVSPFMGYVDRFILGALVSSAAVTFYVAPQEIVTKLWIVPSALTAVLLPSFAARMVQQGQEAWRLFQQSLGLLLYGMWPLTLGLALFAHDLLAAWLGREFALRSTLVLQLFAFGTLINCMAHLPLTWLHAAGRFRATAYLYCLELPLFLLALWLLCGRYGLMGAAWAWLLRIVVDTLALFLLALQQAPKPSRTVPSWRQMAAVGLVFASFALIWLPSTAGRLFALIAVLGLAVTMTNQFRRDVKESVPAP